MTARRIHLNSLAAREIQRRYSGVTVRAGGTYLPSFLRCTRVRRSSLRCFFFDMRLRRFLMTEPMNSAI